MDIFYTEQHVAYLPMDTFYTEQYVAYLTMDIFTLNNMLHNFFELQQVYLCKFITTNQTILQYKNNWPSNVRTASMVLLLLSSTQSANTMCHNEMYKMTPSLLQGYIYIWRKNIQKINSDEAILF